MNTNKTYHRRVRLAALVAATGSLLLLLFCSLIGTAVPAHADGNILRVPDDYATIQAAIDAAQPGDEIRIVGGGFVETLYVSKSITLSGGWNADFTGPSPFYTALEPTGLGRGITISGTADVAVAIDAFAVLGGDATGLGGIILSDDQVAQVAAAGAQASFTAASALDSAAAAAQARTHLEELAAQGHLPGGEVALPSSLARLERLTAQAGVMATAAAPTAGGVADCGGAIYVRGASLHLSGSLLGKDTGPNVASRTGLGAGGGLCAVDIPAGGLHLEKVQIEHNAASLASTGLGGGVFVSTTAPSAIHFVDFSIFNNVASRGGSGAGGGVYLFDAPGAVLQGGGIEYNLASAAGVVGFGGGVAIANSPRTHFVDLSFSANSANAAWSPLGLSVARGFGGALSITASDDVVIADSVNFLQNQAALHGQGTGGGLYAEVGTGLRIDGAMFQENWSIVYPFEFEGGQSGGGGIALLSTQDTQITATLTGNQVAVFNQYCQDVYGGALFGVGVENFHLTGSQVSGNAGGGCDQAARPVAHGAVSLVSGSQNVTIAGNRFTENVTELGEFVGMGGALFVADATAVQIRANEFLSNISGVRNGVGGALVLQGASGVQIAGNRMIANHAAGEASAQFALGGAVGINTSNDLQIVNNVLAFNSAGSGGGILLVGGANLPAGSVTIVNNTLYANAGEGGVNLREWTTPITLTNNIVVSHTTGVVVESGAAALRYTLYHANSANSGGAGAIDDQHAVSGAPAFADATDNDFHLLPGSAAIDAGDPAGIPPAPPVDIEDFPRPFGPRVDIGAYEWHGPQLYLPVITRQMPVRFGWAVGNGDDGLPGIVHTTDGGLTWTRQSVAAAMPGLDAGDISAVDEQTAWAAFVADSGVTFPFVLHTTDGGATWMTQTLPAGVSGGVKSIKGVSRTEAWAATLDGVILHTTDGGATWTVIPHPGIVITQVNRMDVILPHVWIADAANDGAIIHSMDGGATWRREVITDAGATEGPLTVHAVSPDVAWASGTRSLSFFRTVDGGGTWEKVITVGGFDHLDDICASSAADVWGAQNGDGVNGHIHWVDAPPGGAVEHGVAVAPALQGYTPGGVSCVDSRTAWVVAPKGVPLDPAKPRGIIVLTTDGQNWLQASAPADIRYWKISMVGARR
jgi:photosystem II stability/assembly factor-like uncharacterized protein